MRPRDPGRKRVVMARFYASARRVAELISERLGAHLDAQVAVVDQRDVVIASTQPGLVGFPLDWPAPPNGSMLRVPLPIEGESWQVVLTTQVESSRVTQIFATEMIALLLAPERGAKI